MSSERRRGATLGAAISLVIHLAAAILVWPGPSPANFASDASVSADGANPSIPISRAPAADREGAPPAGARRAGAAVATVVAGPAADRRTLIDHLGQSSLFAIALGLLTIAFRRNSARVRYWLWFGASAKFLIPFAAVAALGGMLPLAPVAETIASSAVWMAPVTASPPQLDGGAIAIPAAASGFAGGAWRVILLGIWVSGGAGIALSRLGTWRRIRRVVLASRAIDLADVVMVPGIRVYAAPGLLEPAVVGLVRPILLLPAGLARHLTASQLQAVIAHEIAHVRRRDNLTAAVHMVVEAVFWFHPLVWWIGARLVAERERACDEEVLRRFAPRTYVDAIVSVCRRYVDAPMACMSGVGGSDLPRRIEAIMRNEPREPVTRVKQLALASSAALALGVPLWVGVVNAPRVRAQAATPAQAVAFEVASVKPNTSPNRGGPFGPQPGGRFVATNAPVSYLIRFAYEPSPWNRDLDSFQMSGGPDWLTADRFDVNAKAPADVPLIQMRRMVQALLIDRFKLRVRYETRERPLYRLVLARADGRLGPQLRPTALKCAQPIDPFAGFPRGDGVPCGYFGMSPTIDPGSGTSNQAFRGMTMEGFARRLQSYLGRAIVDRTGLAGYYDGDFEFTAEIAIPPPPPGRPHPYEGRVFPSIFSVLPQQLGLRLESGRGPVDVLVIESIERPTEN
jgi:bla regulator protein blaR1